MTKNYTGAELEGMAVVHQLIVYINYGERT